MGQDLESLRRRLKWRKEEPAPGTSMWIPEELAEQLLAVYDAAVVVSAAEPAPFPERRDQFQRLHDALVKVAPL